MSEVEHRGIRAWVGIGDAEEMPEKYVKVRLFVEPAPRGIDREVHAISIRALDTEDAPAQPEATLTDGSASAPVVGSDRDGGET